MARERLEQLEARWYIGSAALSAAGLGALAMGLPHLAGALLVAGALLLLARFALSLAAGVFTVDLLMAIVAIVAYSHGLILEGLIVYALYSVAEAFEDRIEALARRRLESATKLLSRSVLVEENGGASEAPVESLRPGDIIVVRVGEAVPADGTALSEGSVDASIVTGEPVPERVEPGSLVLSGSVVVEGPLRLRVEKPPHESFAQRLVSEALETLEEKPMVYRMLERLSPAITGLVLALFAAAHLTVGPVRALSILVAGCPSAFIIASSFQSGYQIARLARHGILVRGGRSLEAASGVDTVVLDKTGTLTKLEPETLDADPRAGRIVGLAAAVARHSRHPVARSIASLPAPGDAEVEWVREERGSGLVGVVSGVRVEIRSGPEMDCGKSVLIRSDEGEALLCLREAPAEGASELIEYLKRRGLRIVLASGDLRANVERIASLLGIEEYHASMKPEDKAALVKRLQAEGRRVAFIGDGVNDSIALAATDFSVAVGSIDLTREIADAVAPHGPRQVLRVFKAAHTFRPSLLAAFAVASIVKTAVAAAGLTGHAPLPLVALLGDDGSTLAAVAAGVLADRLSWR